MTATAASQVVAFPEAEVSILDAYLRGLLTETTRKVYRRCIGQFDTFLGGRDLLSASRREVEAYRSYMEDLGRAPSTIGKAMSALTGYYGFAVDEEAIEKNPAARARRPKLPQESPRMGLSRQEVRALFDATSGSELIDHRDRALVMLLAIQALRLSEALGLHVEDLGEELGHHVAVVRGKGAKVSRVPLAAPVHQAIQDWTTAAGIESGPIFVRVKKGGAIVRGRAISPQCAWKRIRVLGERAGLSRPVHPHLFRHGAATAALDAGVPLREVQDHLRHADPRTTRRYDSHRRSLNNPAPHVLAAAYA